MIELHSKTDLHRVLKQGHATGEEFMNGSCGGRI